MNHYEKTKFKIIIEKIQIFMEKIITTIIKKIIILKKVPKSLPAGV